MKGSFPKNLELVIKCDPNLPLVRGDATQIDFGKSLGVMQNVVSRYERGRVRPPLEYLTAVSRYGKVTLDWLILGEKRR